MCVCFICLPAPKLEAEVAARLRLISPLAAKGAVSSSKAGCSVLNEAHRLFERLVPDVSSSTNFDRKGRSSLFFP